MELIGGEGYCWARDGYLANETQLNPRNLRHALARLRDLGAIEIRWVKMPGGGQQRRIFPHSDIIRLAQAEVVPETRTVS